MKINLNGKWYLDSSRYSHLPASIPGSVLSTLLKHHLIEDPFFRDNENKVREILFENYTFSRKFTLTKEQLKNQNILCMDSIDTIAEVFVNQTLVAKLYDMHTSEKILLDPSLLSEENEICIRFQSPYRYIENYDDQGIFDTYAITEKKAPCIRKAHHMFGWDWGPNLADMGIFRDIYIESTVLGYLDDFRHECTFLPDGSVQIDVETNSCLYTTDATISVTLSLDEDGTFLQEKCPLKSHNTFRFLLKEPKRWYPVGYGSPTLYHLTFCLASPSGESKEYKKRIGIREVVIDNSKDQYGTNFGVTINSCKIFLKGSNYIPEDNVLSRITPDRSRRLLKLAKDFHHNLIRVWGGGYYPSEDFYDYCDENGLLVWQDLMFACAVYNIHDEHFKNLIIREITSAVKSFRHHASVFLIAGDNECEDGVNGHEKEKMEAYKIMSLEVIVPLMKQLTSTYFLRTSPRSAEIFQHQNDTEHFDTHYWGIWGGEKPLEEYKTIFPRLLSEVGHQSFPLMTTIEKFAPKEEWSIQSPSMLHHQKQPGSNTRIAKYIDQYYGTPVHFEDFVYLSHLVQGEAMKLCAEHLRRIQNRCNGFVYWQLNDCWPGISWSSVDYYFGLKALHYFSGNFFAPHLVSVDCENDVLTVHVSNTTAEDIHAKLQYRCMTFDGKILDERTENIFSEKAASQKVLTIFEPFSFKETERKDCVVQVRLLTSDDKLLSENYYQPVRDKEISYPTPHFTITPIDDYSFEISSDTFAKNVFLRYEGEYAAVFSENYFCLPKDGKKIITLDTPFVSRNLKITSVNQVDFV